MKYASIEEAQRVINEEKIVLGTAYFDEECVIKMVRLKEALRSCSYGEQEVNVITAALVLAGAKFIVD